jgi:polyhydroxyalkanoate synthesis repressor PhaR
MAAQEDRMVTIKKYGNRRLYNTDSSSYINMEQLAELIQGGAEVQVVDVKTGEDLTREVLLQVVMEVLHGGDLFTVPMLRRIIRSTGSNPWARMMNQQLVTGLRLLSTQLDQAERMFELGNMPGMSGMPGMPGLSAPFGFAGAQAPKPSPRPEPASAPERSAPAEPAPEPSAPAKDDDAKQQLDDLRARLADLEKLLKG